MGKQVLRVVNWLIVIAMGLALLGGSALSAVAQTQTCPSGCSRPGGTVRVSSATNVQIGQEFVLTVQIENVTNMYGIELALAFNPAILQVKDSKPGTVGVQIEPGDFPDPFLSFNAQNAADNTAGTIAYAVSLLRPAPPASGSGVLARIYFQAIAPGTSAVSITRVMAVAADSCCLETTTQDGSASVQAVGGTVTGRVLLQGRTNYSGVTVSIGGRQVTTGANGAYSISGVPVGTHTISAAAATYLDSQRGSIVVSSGGTTTVPDVTLLAGDVDDNCTINIFDLVALGAVYGTTPPGDPRVDYNQDNTVNIFDLVLLAANYGLSCPGPW